MADTKLSALTALAVEPADADELYINDGGVSKKIAYGVLKVELQKLVNDTSPQLGGSLDVNGNKIVSLANGNIDIEPNGTGNVLLGNFVFDADQTVGAGQDNYVLTYNNAAGHISLEESTGGASSPLTTKGDIWVYSTTDDRLPIGTDDYVLTADSTAGTGMAWKAAAGGGGGWDVDDQTNGNYGHGLNALASVTVGSGIDVIAIGENAGTAITTGDNSVFIGTNSGQAQTTKSGAVAVGVGAFGAGNGTNLVGIGLNAVKNGGNYNVGVGQGTVAGGSNNTAVGNYTLGGLTSGLNNTAYGNGAGDNLTTGSNCIALGYQPDFDSATENYQIVVSSSSGTTSVPFINGYTGASADVDMSGKKVSITGPSARPIAVTNQDGGDLELRPGQPASGGGSAGNIILTDLPTSDPTVAGALWNSSGTLMISAG